VLVVVQESRELTARPALRAAAPEGGGAQRPGRVCSVPEVPIEVRVGVGRLGCELLGLLGGLLQLAEKTIELLLDQLVPLAPLDAVLDAAPQDAWGNMPMKIRNETTLQTAYMAKTP